MSFFRPQDIQHQLFPRSRSTRRWHYRKNAAKTIPGQPVAQNRDALKIPDQWLDIAGGQHYFRILQLQTASQDENCFQSAIWTHSILRKGHTKLPHDRTKQRHSLIPARWTSSDFTKMPITRAYVDRSRPSFACDVSSFGAILT